VDERPVLARFWHVRHLALGTPHLAPNVTSRRVRHAVIEKSGAIDFHVDGEPSVATDRVEVTIRPGALNVRVPGF
jgi:diacylglycerol kinase family enzyme